MHCEMQPMRDLWTYLKKESSSGRKIVLYGTGDGADKILERLRADDIAVSAVFASDGFVRERTYRGMKVEAFSQIMQSIKDPLILLAFGSSRPEVLSHIDEIASQAEFYVPDVPVCGGEIFDLDYYEMHKCELDEVMSVLEDGMSRRCMERLICGKVSGELRSLHDAECKKEDIFSLMSLPNEAVYYDLGAYNGDTVKEYSGRFPSIAHIVAVEPEPHSFAKLDALREETFCSCHVELKTYRALISDVCGESHISAAAKGRGTREISKRSGKLIPTQVLTVDHIAEETGLIPDLLKFDIEGSEAAALRGAKKTIAEHRPILRVACYHKSSDFFVIPQIVRSIRPDYRIYMRHLPSVPGWDSDFIFV